MAETATPARTETAPKTQRPRHCNVILLNDDHTPRDVVVTVLREGLRITEGAALGVMLTAPQKAACVVAVFSREVAETKALQGPEMGQSAGDPLAFTTERESRPRRRDLGRGLPHSRANQRGGRGMPGRWYEDFTPGEVIEHAVRRTVTEADNVTFSTATMNPAALHLDYAAAAETEFGRPLVNSIFTLGLVIGLSVGDTTLGTAVANLGMSQTVFPAPVFYGDTIRVTTEVVDKRPSKSRPGQGIVTFRHRGLNQKGEVVCDCTRQALMRMAPA